MSDGKSDLRDALPMGAVVGGYEVEALLGHGGYSVVYRAHHSELGHVVALKEYLPADLSVRDGETVFPRSTECIPHYEDGKRRFLEEAKRIIQFKDDPGVVAFLDFFRANGTAYLVMEHVDGMSLAELLRQREGAGRAIDENELRSLVVPLLATLSRLHKADVLHRDIKPSNILVRRSDCKPVLIDFGAAKQQAALHSKSLAPFTEGYAALEQVGEGELGPWTDVYAIGAVMWRVVAGGQSPWSPPNPVKAELRARAALVEQSDPMPSACELGKGRFSLKTLNLIDRCLALNSANRPKDCGELLVGMGPTESNSEDAGEIIENPPARSRTTLQPIRRLNARVLGLGLAAVALLATLGFLLLRAIEPTIDRDRNTEVRDAASMDTTSASVQFSRCLDYLADPQLAHEAEPWCRLAAEQGHVYAQLVSGGLMLEQSADSEGESETRSLPTDLALMELESALCHTFFFARGVAEDRLLAAKWCRKAAIRGSAYSQWMLGVIYSSGAGVGQDYAEAEEWVRKAAEQGLSGAQGYLGAMYQLGWGVQQSAPLAASWYRRGAEQGDPDSQYDLAVLHHRGDGVERDLAQAAAWYRKAAERGDPEAQHSLGVAYNYGKGVSEDDGEAVKWYRQAAEQGHAEAQRDLGDMYYHGEGVAKDRARAEAFYRRASKQGLEKSRFSRVNFSGDSNDDSQIADWLSNAAEEGNAEAQYRLGDMYALGDGVVLDDVRALSWYRKSAEQGNPEAQFRLANMYADGVGTEEDVVQSLFWCRSAAEQGFAAAQVGLFWKYVSGHEEVEPQIDLAVSWLRKAAEQDFAEAQNEMGRWYEYGLLGFPSDIVQAAAWYRKAAERENVEAQSRLGLMYGSGEGVEQNSTQAAEWLQKAAEQGEVEAQSKLGAMYADGEGVEKDPVQAAAWLQKAAEQGNVEAQSRLGIMYGDGEGVEKDSVQAMAWLQRAAEQGDVEAQNSLGVMYGDGVGVAKNEARAVGWFRRAAEQGHAMGQFNLGVMYHLGDGVGKDSAQAAAWIQRAAEQRLALAELWMGDLFVNGAGVRQDFGEALAWYEKAAKQGNTLAQQRMSELYSSGAVGRVNNVLAYAWLNIAAVRGDKDILQQRDRIQKLLSPSELVRAQEVSRTLVP